MFDVSTSIDCATSTRAMIASCSPAGGGKSPGSNLLPEGDGHAVGGANVVVEEHIEPSGVSEAERVRSKQLSAAKVLHENGDTWLFGVAGEKMQEEELSVGTAAGGASNTWAAAGGAGPAARASGGSSTLAPPRVSASADGWDKKDTEPDFESVPGDDTQPSSDGRAVLGAATSFVCDEDSQGTARWYPHAGDGRRTDGWLSMRECASFASHSLSARKIK